MSEVAIELNDEEARRIEAIARQRHATPAQVVTEAVRQYLDYDAEFRAAVEEGLEAAARGEHDDLEAVADRLKVRLADRLAPRVE